MTRLHEMSTSNLIAMARNECSSITDIGIHSELLKELTTRLAANTAVVTLALKERDETRTELSSAMLTINQITDVLGTSETLSISEQVSAINQQVVNMAVENSTVKERHCFIRALATSILEHSGGRADWRGAMEDASELIQTVNAVYAALPATDAAIANIQAQGVDKFADDCESDVVFVEPEDTEHYELMAEHARQFAAELRKEAENVQDDL